MKLSKEEFQAFMLMPLAGMLLAFMNLNGHANNGGVGAPERKHQKMLFWTGIALIVIPLIIIFTAKGEK